MPDSWIDRKELEELVGSFSPPRKTRRRLPPLREKEPERAERAEEEEPTLDGAALAPPAEPPAAEADLVRVFQMDRPDSAVEEVAPSGGSFAPVDPAPGMEEPAQREEPAMARLEEEPEDPEPSAMDGELPDAGAMDFPDPVGVGERCEGAGDCEVPPPLPVAVSESPCEAEAADIAGEAMVAAAAMSAEEDVLPGAGADPAAGELPEIRFESAGEEEVRELPGFLDDRTEMPLPRPSSLSERDADRALAALAEARLRAERSRLLRVRSSGSDGAMRIPEEIPSAVTEEIPEEIPSAESEEVPAVIPDEGGEAEEAEEAERESAPLPADGAALDFDGAAPPEASPGGFPARVPESVPADRFLRRLERFGEEARGRLDAREVIVCDRDGLLLYSDADDTGKGGFETALLLEISARTNRLLGLEASRATQVSAGGGLWRCLLRQSVPSGDIYAGLLLREPLEEEEIVFWTGALAATAGEPSPAPRGTPTISSPCTTNCQ